MSGATTFKHENQQENRVVLLNQDIGYLLLKYLDGWDVINFMEEINGSEQFSNIEINHDYAFYKAFLKFVDKEKIKLNIPCIEQDFETWIMDDTINYLCHDSFYQQDCPNLRPFVHSTFTVDSFKSMCDTYKTASFQCYCRLLSFNTHTYVGNLLLVDYFYSKRSLGCLRELNEHETSLFKECSLFRTTNYETLNKELSFVGSMDEFLKNFESRFHSNVWLPAINFDIFHVSGGCVLNSLCKTPFFDTDMQTIDVNFHGNTFEDFDTAVHNVFNSLSMMRTSDNDNQTIVLKKKGNGSYIITLPCKSQLQFNFKDVPVMTNPLSYILHSSDIDITQVAFTGSNVVCTFGFLQAISTKSFLCYTMHCTMSKNICNRIIRYCQRGFNFLKSECFNDTWFNDIMSEDILEEVKEETKEIMDVDGEFHTVTITYTPHKTPLPNVDTYELQEKFIERIVSQKFCE